MRKFFTLKYCIKSVRQLHVSFVTEKGINCNPLGSSRQITRANRVDLSGLGRIKVFYDPGFAADRRRGDIDRVLAVPGLGRADDGNRVQAKVVICRSAPPGDKSPGYICEAR